MGAEQSRFCQCLYYSTQALARSVGQLADGIFAKVGLTTSYAYLLIAISEEDGIQPMKLSQELNLTPSTITRLVEKMEQKRFVYRETEGKTTRIFITERGEGKVEEIKQCWQEFYQAYQQILGAEESSRLAALALQASAKISEAISEKAAES